MEWHASCYKQPNSFPWRLALKHLVPFPLSLVAGYDPRLSSCWHKILPLMLPREPRRGQRGRTWMNEVPMAQRPRVNQSPGEKMIGYVTVTRPPGDSAPTLAHDGRKSTECGYS